VSIGASADMRGMNSAMLNFTIILTLLAILTKIIGCGAGALLSKFNLRGSFKIGIGMIARGEVALIVSTYGLDQGIIGKELYTAMVVMAIVTTLVTPPLLKIAFKEKE
jgi:Kef-type K+ transport system membrane component KefB